MLMFCLTLAFIVVFCALKAVVKLAVNWLRKQNPLDLAVTILTVIICATFKFKYENWNGAAFMLSFTCIRFGLLVLKSFIIFGFDINEVHIIKLMLLALVFVFLQVVLFSVRILFSLPVLWLAIGLACIINMVLRKLILQ